MIAPIEDGGYAFPCPHPSAPNEGMTLRDWFAGQALASMSSVMVSDGILAAIAAGKTSSEIVSESIAGGAYKIADAMLAARKERS